MSKLFVCGVANIFGYAVATGDLLFQSKTLLDSSIDIKTANTPIKAGYGNQLQFIYFHDGELIGKLTETQFSLNFIGSNVGASVGTGKNVWFEEQITLTTGGAGTVTNTPIVQPDISGSTVYGWVTDKNGVTTKVTFTTKNFTLAGGAIGDVVTVRYFMNNTATTYVQIPANIIPSVVRLVMDAQLFSGDGTASGSTLVGKIEIEIGRAQLDGNQSIAMTSSGVSNTPLSFMALAATDTSGNTYYAQISQILSGANWYDNVLYLVATVDPISLTTANSPLTVDLRAVPSSGSAFKVPNYADITWSSSDVTKFTVANGALSKVAVGTANLNYSISAKPSVSGQTVVTVS